MFLPRQVRGPRPNWEEERGLVGVGLEGGRVVLMGVQVTGCEKYEL